MYEKFYNKFIRPVFTINGTPHSIALGVSLGLFVSLTPTVGFQMILVVIVGTLIRANRIIAILLCWISNPITFIPMYYGYYWLGGKLLNVELWTFSNFSEKMEGIMALKDSVGSFGILKQLGSDIGSPLFFGSLVLAAALSIPMYPITLIALKRNRARNKLRAEMESSLKEAVEGAKPKEAGFSSDPQPDEDFAKASKACTRDGK